MLSFHNKLEVKKFYLDRVKAHRLADELVQGTGWENGKGCAVGCTLEVYDHSRYPTELGLPIWLANLEDTIFENLPKKEAQKWPEQFLKAIPIGIRKEQFEALRHKLAIIRQKRNLKLQKQLQKKYKDVFYRQVIDAINLVIEYHKNPTELAARSAAESAARSAAWSAAASAAWSAAASAAESAAFKQEAKDLLKLLKELKPLK